MQGDCSDNKSRETYVDYEGAVKCLSEGAGDIAFTKHTTIYDYTIGGSSAQTWSRNRVSGRSRVLPCILPSSAPASKQVPLRALPPILPVQNDLRLVCPGGGCRPITEWASCNIAGSATHTFVGQRGFAATAEGAGALQVLAALNSSFITASRSLDSANPNLLFTAGAAGTRLLSDPTNPVAHFGDRAANYFRATRNLQVRREREGGVGRCKLCSCLRWACAKVCAEGHV